MVRGRDTCRSKGWPTKLPRTDLLEGSMFLNNMAGIHCYAVSHVSRLIVPSQETISYFLSETIV